MTAALGAAVDARAEAGRVELALSVENRGDEAATLVFPDAKRAEFVARDDGGEVWRWSRGRMFAQSTGEVTLAPGEERAFEATWESPPPGEYRVEAELAVAADGVGAALAAETAVTVPE